MVHERVIEGGAIVDEESSMSAEEYSNFMTDKLGGEYREFAGEIAKDASVPQGARILEIGPGPGWIGIFLAELRPDVRVVGVEPSPDMRRVAAKNADGKGVGDRVTYVHGFVESLSGLGLGTFDAVILNESLHHWEDPVRALKEIASSVHPKSGRVLVKNGRRDLGIVSRLFLNTIGRVFAGRMFKDWKASLMASYTPGEIEDMLGRAGLNDWRVTPAFLSLSIQN